MGMETGEFPYVFPRHRPEDFFSGQQEVCVHVGGGFFRIARVVSVQDGIVAVETWSFSHKTIRADLRSPDLMMVSEKDYFTVNHLPLPDNWWEPNAPPQISLAEMFAFLGV